MIHLVNISGGMASAVALFRVIERYGVCKARFADTNYRTRFAMPTALKPPLGSDARPMYWSSDIGFAHLIALNTDTCEKTPCYLAAHNSGCAATRWLQPHVGSPNLSMCLLP